MGPPYKIAPEDFKDKYLKAVDTLLRKENRVPTQIEVAKALNISRRTLQYKLKQMYAA